MIAACVGLCKHEALALLTPPSTGSVLPLSTSNVGSFTFLSPAASFVHHQLMVAAELHRRGHNVTFITFKGFDRHYARHFPKPSSGERPPPPVYEVPLDFDWSMDAVVSSVMGRPFSRNETARLDPKATIRYAFLAYNHSIRLLVEGAEKLRALGQPVFPNGTIVIVPGPWASGPAYCKRNKLPYVVINSAAQFADVYDDGMHMPMGRSLLARMSAIPVGTDSSLSSFRRRFEHVLHLLWTFNWRHQLHNEFAAELILRDGVLRLIDGIPSMAATVRPSGPLTVFTGPLVSTESRDPKYLSHTSRILLSNGRPTVYISFGTHAVLKTHQLDTLVEAFVSDTWNVLWALPTPQVDSMSESARSQIDRHHSTFVIEPWIHTPAVLAHPSVIAFVSHCGSNGLGEAIATGRPVIGLPLFGDQPANCHAAERTIGMARVFSLSTVTPGELRAVVKELVSPGQESVLARNARHAQILASKAYGGMDKAIDWLMTAYLVQGNFASLATPAEREGLRIGYALDIFALSIAMLALVCLGAGWQCGRCATRARRHALFKPHKTTKIS